MSDGERKTLHMRGVALTDDEVIALGSRVGIPWPSPVPTVDVTNSNEVRRSATRGARSLLVRGLLDREDSLSGDLQGILSPVLRGTVSVGAYMVDSSFAYASDWTALAGYSGGSDAWTAEMISPGGIHYLQEETSDGCLSAVRASLDCCFAEGIETFNKTGRPVEWSFLFAMRRLNYQTQVVAIRKGEVAQLDLTEGSNSSEPASRLRPLASLADALQLLGLG